MCGRYTYFSSEELLSQYELANNQDLQLALNLPDNYNVSPGQHMPVIIRGSQENVLQFMQWGLVPSWSRSDKPALKLINARRESLLEKTMWRSLVKSKRCLVPAQGFYEWQVKEKVKTPFYMSAKHEGVLTFAGLWDEWHDSHGNVISSYCIITTTPNKEMIDIHKRMPAILTKDQADIWLSPVSLDQALLDDLLAPSPDGTLLARQVSTDVNNSKNNSKSLIYSLSEPA